MPSQQRPGPERPGPGDAGAGRADPAASSSGAPSLVDAQPTVLGLARLSRRLGLSPSEESVYRRIAQLVEMSAETEFLVAPCGRGLSTRFIAESTGASGSGVDPEGALIDSATERARAAGMAERLHYDPGPVEDLPYKDDVFDVVIGDVGLSASSKPVKAVAELARVARPMGSVVLIQPVWNRPPDPVRRDVLIEHLGLHPFLMVEWKQMLREAGVVELYVEDLVDAANPWQALLGVSGALDLPSLRERFAFLRSAWHQWGLLGVAQAIAGGKELRRLITRERLLGLALIKGTKWRDALSGGQDPAPGD